MVPDWFRTVIRQLARRRERSLDGIGDSPEFVDGVAVGCGLTDVDGELTALIDEAADTAFRLGLTQDELAAELAWKLRELEQRYPPWREAVECLVVAVVAEGKRLSTPIHRSGARNIATQLAARFVLHSMIRSGQVVLAPD